MSLELRLNSNQVGIAVRYKDAPNVPTKGFGHIDVILPGGGPIGFYGKGDGPTASASAVSGLVRSGGFVLDYPLLTTQRPEYVNLNSARAKPCRTTIVVVNTTPIAAAMVSAFWNAVSGDKNAIYNLWGGNCSSYALESLVAADLLPDESVIEHFSDTPDKVFEKVSGMTASGKPISGFVGFVPLGGDNFKIVIQ